MPAIDILFWLGVVFIVLKVVGAVSWPWLWVLAPWWIALGFFILGVILALIIGAAAFVFGRRR